MMPFDSELTRLQGELQDIEGEIAAIDAAVYLFEGNDKMIETYNRTLARLTGLKELAQMKISVCKERMAESGVKY